MKNILKEGIWDNIITGVKKAQKTASSKLGNATSSGELALIKTTEMLHIGFETWCGANNRKTTDSDALYEYLIDDNVVGFSDEFAHKWANKYDEFMRDPNSFLQIHTTGSNTQPNNPSAPPNTPSNSPNQNTPVNNSSTQRNQTSQQTTPPSQNANTSNQATPQYIQDQIDYTEQIYGPILQNHLSSVVYKQYASGHKPSSFTNKQDGLFIFVTKANLAIMKNIRDEIKASTLSKKEKYNEYVKRGVMKPWKDIAAAIRVKPTEDNAKLAIANSMKVGLPRNYFNDIHRFAMSNIKDSTLPFIITESSDNNSGNDSKKILILEDLSSKLRQFFKLIAADGNKTGATRQAVHNSRSRNNGNSSSNSNSNSSPATSGRNTNNVPAKPTTQETTYAHATPEVSFSKREIDYIKSAEENINGGLVGLANVTQTANIQHKKEIGAIIKKIVAAGLSNLKKNHPNILS